MSATLDAMTSEEPKINMTPMIDIVFLLIIFFMCLNFKTFENKLPSQLPLDQGLMPNDIKILQQVRFQIMLLPGHSDKIRIMPDPNYEPFHLVEWQETVGENGETIPNPTMFAEVQAMLEAGWNVIGDKIEIAPDPNVPFEYVALTLDAIHAAKNIKEADKIELIKIAADNGNFQEVKRIQESMKKITFMAAPPEGRD